MDQYGCVSMWLDTPFDVCWQRIETSDEDRPLGRTREQAEQLYHVRQPLYSKASIRVSVQPHETLENIVARVEAALASRPV
ncbi:shikimate kinase [compost metagenome]